MSLSHRNGLLVLVAAAALAAAGAQPPQDSTKAAPTTRVTRAATRRAPADSGPHAVARDRVGAADTTCDELCRHERMMDSVYGRNRERVVAVKAAAKPPTRPPR